MSQVECRRFEPSMAGEVARLIEAALGEHRSLPPLNLLAPMAPYARAAELSEVLASDESCGRASFVAAQGGRIVSAAIARGMGESLAWWRIATAPDCRRQGLATRCMLAGETAMRELGQAEVATDPPVDSRWLAAEGLFAGQGYHLDDPQRRNISMMVEGWAERAIDVPAGYDLATLTEADVQGWTDCRNAVFGSDVGPEWLRDHFMSRADFDPSGWFLVRRDGRIVGISGAIDAADPSRPEGARGGMIEYVGVLDEERGHGLGELVVTACLNWLVRRGVPRATLITQPFRQPAIRLYERLGFRTIAAWHRWVKPLT